MKIRIVMLLLSVAGLYGMDDNTKERDPRFKELYCHAPWYWEGFGRRMVEVALKQNNPYALERMFGAGLGLDERNERGETLLHIGVRELLATHQREVVNNVTYLIDRGCDIAAKNAAGDNPWVAMRKQTASMGGFNPSLEPVVTPIFERVMSRVIVQYSQKGGTCFLCDKSGQKSEELTVIDPECLRVACIACVKGLRDKEIAAIKECPSCQEIVAYIRAQPSS
jgi:hypothetical protein